MDKDNKKYCSQCGKLLSKKNKNGLCKKHWDEYRKYGFCISDSPVTEFDNNEIIIHKDYAEIVLYLITLAFFLNDIFSILTSLVLSFNNNPPTVVGAQ